MEAQRGLSDDLMALKRTDSLQGRLEMDGYTRWKEVNLLIEWLQRLLRFFRFKK